MCATQIPDDIRQEDLCVLVDLGRHVRVGAAPQAEGERAGGEQHAGEGGLGQQAHRARGLSARVQLSRHVP